MNQNGSEVQIIRIDSDLFLPVFRIKRVTKRFYFKIGWKPIRIDLIEFKSNLDFDLDESETNFQSESFRNRFE